MVKAISLAPVGVVIDEGQLQIHEEYRAALNGADEFSHLIVLWWADGVDGCAERETLVETDPYRGGPAALGVFATRSPRRPNPVGLSVVEVVSMDAGSGTINVSFIDANNGTPIVDLKPYTPSLDRVENPSVANWCIGWPRNVETSGDFDWTKVF